MKKLLLYTTIMTLFLAAEHQAGAQEVMNRYLQTAAEHNPGLKSKFDAYMAALEVAPQSKALPDPQLAFGYFISPVETRLGPQEFKVSATQMFPWFGTLEAKENAAVQTAKARYEDFEEAKSHLFNEIRGTYYNLYFNQKAVRIIEENLKILALFRNMALVKVESGQVSAVDDYRIQMEIGDLENQLALLKDKEHTLEVSFFNLINVTQEQIEVPDTLWDSGLDLPREAMLDSIQSRNHHLLSLEWQREALSYKQEVAQKSGYPDFSIGLDYIFVGTEGNSFSGKDAIMFPRIGITIPLYRNKYRAMVREAAYQESAKVNQKTERENRLEILFEKSWEEFRDADRRMALYRIQLKLADQSIQLLETEYATANKNFEEILRMERKRLFYALELEKARADKQAAVSFIQYLMGK